MLKTVGNPASRTGDQTIVSGNLIVGTAGKGIDFSANANAAGMTSETLTWYEEGTWTPALAFSTPGDSSFGYNYQTGSYTRIGRQITLSCYIALNAFSKGTASGGLRITGLPFTAGTFGTNSGWTGSIAMYDAPFSNTPTTLISAGQNYISLLQMTGNAGWSSLSDPDADSQYFVTITYTV
jgi:hypothetical protein